MSAPGQREWTHGNLGRVNHLSKLHPVLNVVEANLSFYKRHVSSVLLPSCHCIITGKLHCVRRRQSDLHNHPRTVAILLKIVINQIERKICKNQNIIGKEMQARCNPYTWSFSSCTEWFCICVGIKQTTYMVNLYQDPL